MIKTKKIYKVLMMWALLVAISIPSGLSLAKDDKDRRIDEGSEDVSSVTTDTSDTNVGGDNDSDSTSSGSDSSDTTPAAATSTTQSSDSSSSDDSRQRNWSELVDRYFGVSSSTSSQSNDSDDDDKNRKRKATSSAAVISTSTVATSTKATSTATTTVMGAMKKPTDPNAVAGISTGIGFRSLKSIAGTLDKFLPLASSYDSTGFSAPVTWALTTTGLVTGIVGVLMATGRLPFGQTDTSIVGSRRTRFGSKATAH